MVVGNHPEYEIVRKNINHKTAILSSHFFQGRIQYFNVYVHFKKTNKQTTIFKPDPIQIHLLSQEVVLTHHAMYIGTRIYTMEFQGM